MNNTLNYNNRFTKFCTQAATVILGVIFALLSFAAFIQTEVFDNSYVGTEYLTPIFDNIFINIILLAIIFTIGIICIRKHVRLYKISPLILILVMITITTLLTGLWNIQTELPPISDSSILANSAREFAQGNYSQLKTGPNPYGFDPLYYENNSYYSFYPFQLGYVFISELIIRLFGTGVEFFTLKVVNIIAIDFAYIGLVLIIDKLFKNRTVTCMAAIGLTFCLQSVFYSVFTYGNILGMTFSIWAIYFTIKYMQENKFSQIVAAAFFMILAVIAKYNNMIIALAIAISLILHTIDKKKITALVMAIIIVAAPFFSQQLIIKQYELRAGVNLKTEMKQLQYLAIGLSEGENPGWYNEAGIKAMLNNDMDPEKYNEETKSIIKERINTFTSDFPYGIIFFFKKMLTQFNEPTYSSIWLSQTRSAFKGTAGDFENSFYYGNMYNILLFYFNFYSMLIYIGFSLYLLRAFLRRDTSPQTVIIPISIIGAFLYHMLFEGKSQYIFPYFILMIPLSVAGIYFALKFASKRISFLFKSHNTDKSFTGPNDNPPLPAETHYDNFNDKVKDISNSNFLETDNTNIICPSEEKYGVELTSEEIAVEKEHDFEEISHSKSELINDKDPENEFDSLNTNGSTE